MTAVVGFYPNRRYAVLRMKLQRKGYKKKWGENAHLYLLLKAWWFQMEEPGGSVRERLNCQWRSRSPNKPTKPTPGNKE